MTTLLPRWSQTLTLTQRKPTPTNINININHHNDNNSSNNSWIRKSSRTFTAARHSNWPDVEKLQRIPMRKTMTPTEKTMGKAAIATSCKDRRMYVVLRY